MEADDIKTPSWQNELNELDNVSTFCLLFVK